MPRRASGNKAVLTKARAAIVDARTVEQLRQAQAVVLPLDFGLSLQDTARAIGVSRGWVCQLRRRFMHGGTAGPASAPTRGGRHRQNMTPEQEREFLAPFAAQAAAGDVIEVRQVKSALDEALGRKVALTSAYNLLHRHGWRKLAPETNHLPRDAQALHARWELVQPQASTPPVRRQQKTRSRPE